MGRLPLGQQFLRLGVLILHRLQPLGLRHCHAAELSLSVADLCRRHGVSDATVYLSKAKYGGMDVSKPKRLKGLETGNARLERLLADDMPDNAALKDLAVTPFGKRQSVAYRM